MIPWDWWGNWGIPKGEKGELYCAMHAGMPYLHCYGEEDFKIGKDNRSADIELLDKESLQKELNRIKPLCELQEKLYNKEMVRHEFLDGKYIQRTTYSDGTTVTADFRKGTWTIGSINND